MRNGPKVFVMTARNGCRKPKMMGSAYRTLTLYDGLKYAYGGAGRCWVVEAPTADDAREAIRSNSTPIKYVDDRVMVMGATALALVAALPGTVRRWNADIREVGRAAAALSELTPRPPDPETVFSRRSIFQDRSGQD